MSRALRFLVAGGLLWLAVRDVEVATLWPRVREASGGWLTAAVALLAVDRGLMAWRWLALLRAIDPDHPPPVGRVLRLFFVSTFAGSFLPASIGGDAVRAGAVARLPLPRAEAMASVVVDRLLGTLSVLAMAVVGLLLVRGVANRELLVVAALITSLGVAGALLLLFDSRVLTGLVRILTGRRLATLNRLALKGLAAIRTYGDRRRVLTSVLVGSFAVQVLRILQAWCLGQALGLSPGILFYFAWIPVVILVMLLPISVSGLGTGNLAFVRLFGMAGVTASDAFTLSLLFVGLGVLGNLPGGFLVGWAPRAAVERDA